MQCDTIYFAMLCFPTYRDVSLSLAVLPCIAQRVLPGIICLNPSVQGVGPESLYENQYITYLLNLPILTLTRRTRFSKLPTCLLPHRARNLTILPFPNPHMPIYGVLAESSHFVLPLTTWFLKILAFPAQAADVACSHKHACRQT